MLNTLRRVKCREANQCSCFSKESFTCMNDGGNYCGIYRNIHETPKYIQPIKPIMKETVFSVNPSFYDPINC